MKQGYKIIDSDGHMVEPMNIWEEYTEAAYRDRAPKVIGHVGRVIFKHGPCEAFPNGNPNPRPESVFADFEDRFDEDYRTWWALPGRLAAMEKEGIDIQIGFPTNGATAVSTNIKDSNLQAALVRAYNNWATDYCRDSENRVQFISMVTMLDVNEAVSETKRMLERSEVASVMLPELDNDLLWSNPTFDPFWQVLQDQHMAASFHGGGNQARRFKGFHGPLASVTHAISFPMDAMIVLGSLIFGSVLEKFPGLRCSFLEANAGWVPFWLGRMDDHAVGRQGRYMHGHTIDMKPSEYFRRQCYVACDTDENTLPFVTEYLGGENLIFNTDYPHADCTFPGGVDGFLNRSIPEEAKRKILWDNALELYGDRIVTTVTE